MTLPVFFASPKDFRVWLKANGSKASELLAGFHKVATSKPCMTWSESVDEALCFGWIDGVRKRIDDASYSIRFTPRKKGSIWSAVNIAKVAKLFAEKRMTAAGEAAFKNRTKAKSGIYSHEQASVAQLKHDELLAFQKRSAAWEFFDAAPAGYRKQALHWVTSAKRDETRRSRLGQLIEVSGVWERLPQFAR